MKWISVKDQHFVEITEYDNGYSWFCEDIGDPFMVAVPTNKGWCIQQVVLVDGVGLQCWSDDEGPTYFGWDIMDVTHWFKPTEPYKIDRSNN